MYDDATGTWHERTYTDPLLGQLNHRAITHAFAYSTNVVGDYTSNYIYALDPFNYSDNGAVIRRMRTSPHISQQMVRMQHHMFQLDMEVGVGLDGTTQGTNPQVMLSWSDDYGHTWSQEHWKDAGQIGQYRQRVRWYQLGITRDRVYRVVITDPVEVNLVGAQLNVDSGRN